MTFAEMAEIIKRHVDLTRTEFEGSRFSHSEFQESTLYMVARDFARMYSREIVGHENSQEYLDHFVKLCGFEAY